MRYDTADLSRNAAPLDEEAYLALFAIADRQRVAAIDRPPLSRGYYRHVSQALETARQHGPLVVALMGEVENPEHVAEMADFFLRMKGCSWALAGGAFEGVYVLSAADGLRLREGLSASWSECSPGRARSAATATSPAAASRSRTGDLSAVKSWSARSEERARGDPRRESDDEDLRAGGRLRLDE